jgi:hypothetical protein
VTEPKDNIVIFPGITPLSFEPSVILNGAIKENLESVVVLGWDKDGGFFFSSSVSGGPEILWLLELAKSKLMNIGNGEIE